jgi:PAS domain S-box-containing protein
MQGEKEIQIITNQLEELENRRKLALSLSKVGIWEWDIAANTLIWDENMLDIYGLARYEFSGRYVDWAKRVHPDDLPTAEKRLQSCIDDISGKTQYFFRFRIQKDNLCRWVCGIGNCVRDEDGRPLKVIGINILEPYDVCIESTNNALKTTKKKNIKPSRKTRKPRK